MSKKKHKRKRERTRNKLLLIMITLIVAMLIIKVDITTQPGPKDGMITKVTTISAPRIKVIISVDTYPQQTQQEEDSNVYQVE